jgi:hypothetical protein
LGVGIQFFNSQSNMRKEMDLELEAHQHAKSLGISIEPHSVFQTRQAWLDSAEDEFQPACIHLYPEHDRLCIIAALQDTLPRNKAIRLNETTWELGDVFEIFLQMENQPNYLEIHVTPENQRLQLRWTARTFDLFKAGERPLEASMVADPDWIESQTVVTPEKSLWLVYTGIPWSVFDLVEKTKDEHLYCAFCRYDINSVGKETLSATPAFPRANFHLRDFWHRLTLA